MRSTPIYLLIHVFLILANTSQLSYIRLFFYSNSKTKKETVNKYIFKYTNISCITVYSQITSSKDSKHKETSQLIRKAPNERSFRNKPQYST